MKCSDLRYVERTCFFLPLCRLSSAWVVRYLSETKKLTIFAKPFVCTSGARKAGVAFVSWCYYRKVASILQ